MATKKTPATKTVKTATTKSAAKKEAVTPKEKKSTLETKATAAKSKESKASTEKKETTKKASVEKTPAKKVKEEAKKSTVNKTEKATAKKVDIKKEKSMKEEKVKASDKKVSKATKEKATPAKATKATAEKKEAKVEKATEKKSAAKKPTEKKAVEKKPAAEKKVAAKKEAKPKKESKKAEKAVIEKPKRRKKAVFVPAPPMGKSDIIDAVRQKPRKTTNKSGHVIAIRSIEKETPEEEVSITMEKYNPEQRSLLDSVDDAKGPIYRYSDEELNEFRDLISDRLEKARKELGYLQGLITRKDEEGTEDTDNRFNHMEDGTAAMEREQVSQLAGRQVQFISHLENAIVRIENKTYGVCRVTGNLIDKKRLRAVPHATLSIEAKKNMRRN